MNGLLHGQTSECIKREFEKTLGVHASSCNPMKSVRLKMKLHRRIRKNDAHLKGGGHGNFHNDFLVPMFSFGDAEIQNNIFKNFKMH